MKKIISALIILAMLCSAFLAAVPAFADVYDVMDELEDLVDSAGRYKERQYTAETWEVFKAAFDEARSALYAQYPDEAKLTEAKVALDAAIRNLKKVTLADLKGMIDTANAIQKDGFSSSSWNNLQNAIEYAEYCYDDYFGESYVDEDELFECYYELKKALQNMKYDTSALDNLISKAKPLYTNHNYAKGHGYLGDYTEQTFAVFSEAYLSASTDANSNDLERITKATEDLDAALAALEALPVPDELKTDLEDLMWLAVALDPSDWPGTAWKMVELKFEQAKEANNDPKISTYLKAANELEQALMNLTNAEKTDRDKLPDRPVIDTSYLEDLIEWCENNLVEKGYTELSWAAFSEVFEYAKAVAKAPKNKSNVKDAYNMLLKAKNELVAVEGESFQSLLEALIEEIEALDPNDFTSASWTGVGIALNEAKNAIQSLNQVQIAAALTALEQAKNNLILDDRKTEDKETQQSQLTEQSQQTEPKQTEPVNNGGAELASGCTSAIGTSVAVMCAVLALGSTALLKKKEN